MRKAGKVWGQTAEIFSNSAFELHRIEVAPQHQCSRHRHWHKFNGFFVESGAIAVTVWQPSGTVDQTVLLKGDFMVVPPGVYHQFLGLESAVVFELYWTELRSDDIERTEEGK